MPIRSPGPVRCLNKLLVSFPKQISSIATNIPSTHTIQTSNFISFFTHALSGFESRRLTSLVYEALTRPLQVLLYEALGWSVRTCVVYEAFSFAVRPFSALWALRKKISNTSDPLVCELMKLNTLMSLILSPPQEKVFFSQTLMKSTNWVTTNIHWSLPSFEKTCTWVFTQWCLQVIVYEGLSCSCMRPSAT